MAKLTLISRENQNYKNLKKGDNVTVLLKHDNGWEMKLRGVVAGLYKSWFLLEYDAKGTPLYRGVPYVGVTYHKRVK
ncbi:MAG: hypothetical protein Q4F63_07450 [Clostridia bacterium]|nr:hypothetical protein [Clostridia bacterium]